MLHHGNMQIYLAEYRHIVSQDALGLSLHHRNNDALGVGARFDWEMGKNEMTCLGKGGQTK
jgi:hypothetical protein